MGANSDFFLILQCEVSAHDENYGAHWTSAIDNGCLLHVHRMALREKGAVPFLGSRLLFSLSSSL